MNLFKTSLPWIPVVIAVLKDNNKYFTGQRPPGELSEGLWEFPGGKIKPQETPQQALYREVKEEINVICQKISPLCWSTTHSTSKCHLVLLFFEVLEWSGQPEKIYYQNTKWVSLEEMSLMPTPPANQEWIKYQKQK